MNGEIISIGTEILLGEITDTNSTWIARQLRDIGVNLFYITAIGDNEDRIVNGLKRGLDRSDLIITTGGLGPTVDDMTRSAVARATERNLEFQQDLLDEIARRFEKYGVPMSENNRRQAYIPLDATVIDNPVGSAPSFIVEHNDSIIISLPGVPREMKYLMEHQILPYLAEKMGLPAIIKARVLHTASIGESALDDAIGEYMSLSNPTVGLAAHSGQADIRLTARADSEAEANAMLDTLEAQIRGKVGRFIFTVDRAQTLADLVIEKMQARNQKLAICEIGLEGQFIEKARPLRNASGLLVAMEQYKTVDDLRFEMHLDENELSLQELIERATEHLMKQEKADFAIVVAYDDTSALGIGTPEKVHSREYRIGSSAETALWGFNWGLGFIWYTLSKEEHES